MFLKKKKTFISQPWPNGYNSVYFSLKDYKKEKEYREYTGGGRGGRRCGDGRNMRNYH
jgi:hypothetical protein